MTESTIYITAIDIDGIHKLHSVSSHLNLRLGDLMEACSQTSCQKSTRTACSRCHVKVISGLEKIPPGTEEERKLLDTLKNKAPNSRLACKVSVNPSINGLIIKMV